MLAQVQDWQPPTPDHENLKSFMQSQIEESIRFDCGIARTEVELGRALATQEQEIDAKQWRDDQLQEMLKSLSYHVTEYQKELGRCREANGWILALVESVAGAGASA
jgi:hypothetical protein